VEKLVEQAIAAWLGETDWLGPHVSDSRGDYRVVYELLRDAKIVDIQRVRHRKDVYRLMKTSCNLIREIMKSAFGIRRKKATNASSPKSLNGPGSWRTEPPVRKQRAKSNWRSKERWKSQPRKASNRQRRRSRHAS